VQVLPALVLRVPQVLEGPVLVPVQVFARMTRVQSVRSG
jgi:hypothetical protein